MEGLSADQLRSKFYEFHGREPRIFRAPGRVNLIGEHTDYNDGFVLPFAIDRDTVVAGASRGDRRVTCQALDVEDEFSFDLDSPAEKLRGDWRDYVEGTVRCAMAEFPVRGGADLVFSSTVPIGGGLSSSAALEVSIGFAFLSLNSVDFDPRKLALAAQRAEHEFVGIRSGIMDQFTSALARAGHALLLDCRSLEIEYIPLELGDHVIAVCDTKVKHELASSEYNRRREECEEGVLLLSKDLPGLTSLRDVSEDELAQFGQNLPDVIFRRVSHVVRENARTLAAAYALKRGDLESVGQLMFESHYSLRDDYEVSSAELDFLVEAARETEGVAGARMTGGGFGGCTVNLLAEDSFENFRKGITESYEGKFGVAPDIYRFHAAEGAREAA